MMRPSPNIEHRQYPHVYIHQDIDLGKRLVIVAESEKGELYDPTLVYHKEMVVEIFGEGSLVRLYEDAQTFNGSLSAYLVRVNSNSFKELSLILEALEFDLLLLDLNLFERRQIIQDLIPLFQKKEEKGNLAHVILSLPETPTYKDITPYFEDILNLSIDTGNYVIEYGKYFSFVADQFLYKDAGAVYAGILAALDAEVSPINKTIPNVSRLKCVFNGHEIKQLQKAGIVSFRETFKKGITCSSSSCAVSTEGSVHKSISNFRIAQVLISQLNYELSTLIGNPYVLWHSDIVEKMIIVLCEDNINIGRIRDFDFSIKVNELHGVIYVDLEFVPIFSVHSMTTHSQVQVYQ